MKELIEMTREEMLKLSPLDRMEALRVRHEWLKKSRKIDKEFVNKVKMRIYNHKNKEKRKEWVKRNKPTIKKKKSIVGESIPIRGSYGYRYFLLIDEDGVIKDNIGGYI